MERWNPKSSSDAAGKINTCSLPWARSAQAVRKRVPRLCFCWNLYDSCPVSICLLEMGRYRLSCCWYVNALVASNWEVNLVEVWMLNVAWLNCCFYINGGCMSCFFPHFVLHYTYYIHTCWDCYYLKLRSILLFENFDMIIMVCITFWILAKIKVWAIVLE